MFICGQKMLFHHAYERSCVLDHDRHAPINCMPQGTYTKGALKKILHQQPLLFLWLLVQFFFNAPLYTPGRGWGFDQSGVKSIRKPHCRKWSNSPTPEQGTSGMFVRLGSLNQLGEHTQITVQTDNGQCAQPRNPPHGQIPHSRLKSETVKSPVVSSGAGGGGEGYLGACNRPYNHSA